MKNTLNALMARLRMKQLQLLIALDDHKSLHKAAGVLAMTQSAASKMLHELETLCEAPLFERSKSGMLANQFGHCLIRYARLMAADLGALCDDLAQIRSGAGGRLAIGTIMGTVPNVVVPLLARLHASQPQLAVEVVEDTSLRMLVLLEDGKLDLVIGRASVSDNPDKFHYHPLGAESVSAVVGYGHPAFKKGRLSFRDLQQHRWLVYPGNMPMHELLKREMDQAGLGMPGNQIMTSSALVTVALLQHSADMVALLPSDVAQLYADHRMVRILPLALEASYQSYGIVTRRGGTLSPAADRFIQLLREQSAAP
jgi:DNA-binding transcriptional LysR family regulator